jgi:hypothetical protein
MSRHPKRRQAPGMSNILVPKRTVQAPRNGQGSGRRLRDKSDMMPCSENDFDWIIRNTLPFSGELHQTENACMDRITAALQRGDETGIQTATWLAMRNWKEQVAPCYERVISLPDIGRNTAMSISKSYSDFLCDVSDMMRWCGRAWRSPILQRRR